MRRVVWLYIFVDFFNVRLTEDILRAPTVGRASGRQAKWSASLVRRARLIRLICSY